MVTRTGDREVGVVSGRLPDNTGELARMLYPAEVSLLHGLPFLYEVVRVACQSRSWFVLYAQGDN